MFLFHAICFGVPLLLFLLYALLRRRRLALALATLGFLASLYVVWNFWMLDSYCSDLRRWNHDSLRHDVGTYSQRGPDVGIYGRGPYVHFTGQVDGGWNTNIPEVGYWEGYWLADGALAVRVLVRRSESVPGPGDRDTLYDPRVSVPEGGTPVVGRVVSSGGGIAIDPTASRITPWSLAGIIEFIAGAFVLGVAVRSWLRARRHRRSAPKAA